MKNNWNDFQKIQPDNLKYVLCYFNIFRSDWMFTYDVLIFYNGTFIKQTCKNGYICYFKTPEPNLWMYIPEHQNVDLITINENDIKNRLTI